MSRAWYALRVQSGWEQKVRDSLVARVKAEGIEELITRIMVPAEHVAEIREGKRRVTQQKMYPGYILAEIQQDEEGKVPERVWFVVMETPGISGFVGPSRRRDEIVPLEDEDMQRLLQDMEDRKEKPRPKIAFESGDRVRVKEGPFENLEGMVDEIAPAKGLLKVKLSIFGRNTTVELEYAKVEKL